ncbi:MAG: nuclease-related domain-containing protein [Thermodesulfobacteriota bacterium]
MEKSTSKSPLKEPLLRLPGQSMDEQINCLLNEKQFNYALFAFGFFLLAMGAWIQVFTHSQLNPWLLVAVAIVVIVYCAFAFRQTAKEVRRLKLGRDGERAVAEQLDVVKKEGAIVFHDLIGDGFNLDHVVLSSRGVFVVETKTHTKPIKGSPSVTFDGKTLLINGLEPERDPVSQAEGNARWLAQMLRATTGKDFAVRPVVLFPGWFVKPFPKGSSVWVLNPQALPSFIQHEPTQISESDLHLAAYHLARYIRTRTQGFNPY